MYSAILPPLLTPTLWESRGNIPALVRLLRAFLGRGGQQIVAAGQVTPMLGIFLLENLPTCVFFFPSLLLALLTCDEVLMICAAQRFQLGDAALHVLADLCPAPYSLADCKDRQVLAGLAQAHRFRRRDPEERLVA